MNSSISFKKLISVPFSELRDFILAQPDDRLVNMAEATSYSVCGCVLIQFHKHKLPAYEDLVSACYTSVGKLRLPPTPTYYLIYELVESKPSTYKEVKAVLSKYVNNL